MIFKTALIVFAALMTITAIGTIAFAADPPEGYEWASDKGALKISTDNKHIYIFDTYESLTIDSETIVGWAGKKP